MRYALLSISGLFGCVLLATPRPAQACGGLFCNATQPVVQSGEHIVFAVDASAETVRAIINIQYTGAAPDFAWILPLQSEPSRIAVGPTSLFSTIDRLIGPQFILEREADQGQCQFPPFQSAPDSGAADGGVGGVQVLGQQTVGPYESVVLSSTDPEATRAWLTTNGYNVTEDMIRLVVPYLQKGDVLLALKLRNGQGVEDIQPVDLTMAGTLACVPIRLTAIAALDDLELKITMLSQTGRAIPTNYRHLSLNFAALDWSNPAAFYSGLVSRAADEAGGNAFVTEYAGSSALFEGQIALDTYRRSDLEAAAEVDDYLNQLQLQGLLRREVIAIVADYISDDVFATLGFTRAQFAAGQLAAFFFDGQPIDAVGATAAIWTAVVEPELSAQALFDAYPRVTRLYTLLSPEEMTIDPELEVRNDLDDVSNIHRARVRRICSGDTINTEVTIVGSGEVLLYGNDGGTQAWQRGLPAARTIEQLWDDAVIADRSAEIEAAIAARRSGGPGTGDPDPQLLPANQLAESRGRDNGCGCRAHGGGGFGLWAGVLLLGALRRRRGS
ncbi:MAG: DUF2330 domain-containing protein [Deltaproteobacteria bacterium]|nr:DUF2330 domain-containing protein [Deltaproteobacteria bacterium]